jgi:hypothetical protein
MEIDHSAPDRRTPAPSSRSCHPRFHEHELDWWTSPMGLLEGGPKPVLLVLSGAF